MSQQYPYYGQQSPQRPPDAAAPSADPPPTHDPTPPPTYTPLVLPAGAEWATLQSQQLTSIAAGNPPAELGVKAPGAPQEYPFLMYNAKTRTTKPANDQKQKSDLEGQGYSETPFPAQDPNAAPVEALKALQELYAKAGDAMTTLVESAELQTQQTQPAAPGQQQQPDSQTGY